MSHPAKDKSTTPGRVIIISGPSGAGKSTVVREMLATCPLPLATSISATTRQPRAGERDGVDYFFSPKNASRNSEPPGLSSNAAKISA